MSTLTINAATPAASGTDYLRNVGRAARALCVAILAVPRTKAPAESAAADAYVAPGHDLSLYRLYCLASPYDSVMPNLRQELNMIACRDAD